MRQIVAQQHSKAERAAKVAAAAWLCLPDVLEEKKNEKTQ
jgi:hypothetical protein